MSIKAVAEELKIKGGPLRIGHQSNADLIKLAASIGHVTLHHHSLWSADDKILDVKWKIPPLKRRITTSDKTIMVEWMKYHARFWDIELILHMEDNNKQPYTDTIEIKTGQLKLDELNEFIRESWAQLEWKNNPNHIRGREWKAKVLTQRHKK